MHTPKVAGNTFPLSRAALKRSWYALVAGALLPCAAWAQSARNDGAVYLKQSTFKIPIHVAADKKDLIKELFLYVSTDRGATWRRIQTAKPTDQSFTFRAQTDGEYWFSLAYVDQNDKTEPSDVRTHPPDLQVVIDKTPPAITVDSQRQGDTLAMSWRVDDSRPDLDSLKLEVQEEGSSSWKEVPIRKAIEGTAEFAADPAKSYTVRATITDRAGNKAEKGVSVPATAVADAPSPRKLKFEEDGFSVPPAPTTTTAQKPAYTADVPERSAPPSAVRSIPTAPEMEESPSFAETTAPERPPVNGFTMPEEESADIPATSESFSQPVRQIPQGMPRRPALPPVVQQQPVRSAEFQATPTPPRTNWSSANVQPAVGEAQWMSAYGSANRIPIASTQEQVQPASAVVAEPAPAPIPKPHLSSSPRIEVNYSVKGAGPAGVGKVELWYTQDDGKSWKLYGEDADKTAPFEVVLPSEGRFGLQVIVTSLAGLGQRPPRPNDPPQLVIEVDSTAPTAELYQPVPDTQNGKDRLWLSWSASDNHLPPDPVSLYYAVEPNGELFPIATNLPAEGRYSWQVPKEIPYQVYLVLVAEDLAHNVSKAVSSKPTVVDLSQPEAEVIGVVALPEDNNRR